MAKTTTITLDSPEVQAAKRIWDETESRTGLGRNYTFEWLFEHFNDPTTSFASIGGKAEVSRQAIQQVYIKYFKRIFGDTGRGRIRAQMHIARAHKQAHQKKALLEDGTAMKAVFDQASVAKCDVSLVTEQQRQQLPGGMWMSALLINGHLCKVRSPDMTRLHGKNGRRHVQLMILRSVLERMGAYVIYLSAKGFEPRLFIVPSNVLLEDLFTDTAKNSVRIIAPIAEAPVDHRTLFNLWPYENRWDLLSRR